MPPATGTLGCQATDHQAQSLPCQRGHRSTQILRDGTLSTGTARPAMYSPPASPGRRTGHAAVGRAEERMTSHGHPGGGQKGRQVATEGVRGGRGGRRTDKSRPHGRLLARLCLRLLPTLSPCAGRPTGTGNSGALLEACPASAEPESQMVEGFKQTRQPDWNDWKNITPSVAPAPRSQTHGL